MQDGTTYTTTKPRKILLIGESGLGKTCFAMSLPDPYFVDYDGNLTTAIQMYPGKKFYWDTVETDDTKKPVPLEQQWMRGINLLKANGPRPEVKFIVADGLSRMCDLLQAYLVSVGGEAERVLTIGGLKVMNRSLWLPFSAHLRNYLRLATSFSKPFLLTCHVKIDNNELTEIKEQVPNIQGQIVGELVSWFTDYLQCDTETSKSPTGVDYILRTAPTARIKLKNSMGLPPKIRIAPDSVEFKAMLDKLNGSSVNLSQPVTVLMQVAMSAPLNKP